MGIKAVYKQRSDGFWQTYWENENLQEEAKKRAEERLSKKQDVDLIRAEAALKRSINRLELSKYKK